MKKFGGTLRNHEDLLMNYFKAEKLYSSGIVEGLNLRINRCMRKAYGYRSFELLQRSASQVAYRLRSRGNAPFQASGCRLFLGIDVLMEQQNCGILQSGVWEGADVARAKASSWIFMSRVIGD